MNVEQWDIGRLKPFHNNSRVHDDKNLKAINASIDRFDWLQPIVVDKDGVIIMGHGRLEAAKQLNMEKVPVLVADWLTENEAAAAREADNMTQDLSFFDMDLLNENLEQIDWLDCDMTQFGFYLDDELFGGVEPEEDDYTEDQADEAPSRVQRGEIWKLGDHRLMCGDSSASDDIKTLVGGGEAPMFVFTDPPYGVAIGDKNKMLDECAQKAGRITKNIIGDTLSTDELYDILLKAFSNLRDVCSPECSYYVSSPQGGEIGLMMMMMMRDAGLPVRHNLIWVKNCATFSMGRLDYDYQHEPIFYTWTKKHHFYGANKTTILEHDKPRKCDLHPTMKPLSLIAELMENSSKVGDYVMDIFGGSGSTLIACEQLKRRCYMMELDPHYCDVIIDRWENLTGMEAVRIDA